jgi:hypothetical protein
MLAVITIITSVQGIFSSLKRVTATVETAQYSLPLELTESFKHTYELKFDSALILTIPSYSHKLFKNGRLYLDPSAMYDDSAKTYNDYYATKDELLNLLKYNYVAKFDRTVHYINVITIRNNSNKEIKDLEVNSDFINGYFETNFKTNQWGEFSGSITIKSLRGKSEIILFLYSNEPVTDRRDIKISNSEIVIFPKIIHYVRVKGFMGAFLKMPILAIIFITAGVVVFIIAVVFYINNVRERSKIKIAETPDLSK